MRRDKRRETITSDLTSLIDVVFLLLIFFLVTSTFKKDELALLLNLPQTNDGANTRPTKLKKIIIELTANDLAINNIKLTVPQLDQKIKDIKDKKMPVILRADQKVQYSRLIDILSILQKYQLSNLSLITNERTDKKNP